VLHEEEATLSTTSIRIEKQTHAKPAELFASQHRPIARIVGEVVARYDADLFWKAADDAYTRMSADPKDRAEFDAEVAAWDCTLNDGVADFPYEERDIR
jgi:hypothetical protein